MEADGEYVVQNGKFQSGSAIFTAESQARLEAARADQAAAAPADVTVGVP
jgi:hypothetical protein